MRAKPVKGFAGAATLLGAAVVLVGQPAATPSLQTVSIRQNTTSAADAAKHPMGLGVDSSLLLMIQFVYAPHESSHWMPLPASQIMGGPEWMASLRYDIKMPATVYTDPEEKWRMWRKLLAERFQLKLHRQTKEMPLYYLTAAAGGLKLPVAKAVECVTFLPGVSPHPVPGKVDCGHVAGPIEELRDEQIRGSKIQMADLVRTLALHFNRPIVDKTAYSAEFDLNLRYPKGEMFTAFERQLGLKMTPGQGPAEVLVVDHAELPRP